jgi:histidine triad (HIT) family protein
MDTEFVYEGDNVVAFEDLDPKAPVHVLVIPREHVTAEADLPAETLKQLMEATQKVAEEQGIAEGGYAVRINHGEDAGQEVDHLHVHVLGGRGLSMP